MAFASATFPEAELPRLRLPSLAAGQARRLAGKGLALGLFAGGTIAVLAVSLSVASVWTRAVSLNAPTRLHADLPTAPLISALGEWHRGMIRDAARSGPASGFGTAPDTEPQEIDLSPPAVPAVPFVAPTPPAPAAKPPVHVPTPRPRPAIHVSEAAPPAVVPSSVVFAPPVMAPVAQAAPVPLPPHRPRIAELELEQKPAVIARATPEVAPEPKVPTKPAPEPTLAALPPPAAREPNAPAATIDHRTAVYDIAAHTVYLPNGRRLEAHSGLGRMMDDPDYIRAKMRGPTPPNVYALTLREQLFHGVRAIRLTPVDERKMFGRDGMLAHTYMLGPNGQSNGCVSFRNYDAFLQAFLDGEVNRMVVVPRLDAKTRTALSLPAPKWSLFSAFAD